jgi:hypothetical protein
MKDLKKLTMLEKFVRAFLIDDEKDPEKISELTKALMGFSGAMLLCAVVARSGILSDVHELVIAISLMAAAIAIVTAGIRLAMRRIVKQAKRDVDDKYHEAIFRTCYPLEKVIVGFETPLECLGAVLELRDRKNELTKLKKQIDISFGEYQVAPEHEGDRYFSLVQIIGVDRKAMSELLGRHTVSHDATMKVTIELFEEEMAQYLVMKEKLEGMEDASAEFSMKTMTIMGELSKVNTGEKRVGSKLFMLRRLFYIAMFKWLSDVDPDEIDMGVIYDLAFLDALTVTESEIASSNVPLFSPKMTTFIHESRRAMTLQRDMRDIARRREAQDEQPDTPMT